jgi:Leucine-rich repeat (LRR) protein
MLYFFRSVIREYKDEHIEVDYCNEFLAIHLLETSILKHENQFGQSVVRIQLNRNKLNDLDSRFFCSDERLVEKWSSDLPGLTKLSWERLDKRIFQHLVNLEELDLWDMDSAIVDSNTFACNKNLRKLQIESRELTLNSLSFNGLTNLTELDLISCEIALPDDIFDNCAALKQLTIRFTEVLTLNSQSFKGLVNLTELFLRDNNLAALPDGLFDSCTALKIVNLFDNKLKKLETSTFQNLVNLEEINLSDNPIERADYSNIFACNKNLRILDISGISSTSLNKQSFDGLNLTDLYLCNNKIMSLPDGIFQNITNLKYLDLSNNQISELPSKLFESLFSLENLDLGENEITNIPMGLFDNLISLTFLNLKDNKIEFQEDSDPNTFKGLRKLTNLDLGKNQISILPEGIFKHLVSLEELGIEKNHIVLLPKEFFKGLVSLKYFILDDSRFNSDSTRVGLNFYEYYDSDTQDSTYEPDSTDDQWSTDYGESDDEVSTDDQWSTDYGESDDEVSTDEMINEQNDPEADALKGTKKRDRDCQTNVGETLNVVDDESNPKRFKN